MMPTAVVIATRNRSHVLRRTLEKLAALPEEPHVVVADNGSIDGTAAMLRRDFPEVELLEVGRNLGAAARTVAALVLQEPVIAFADDDSWWAPGALQRAAELFQRHARLGLLAARVLVGQEGRLDPTCAIMDTSPLAAEPDMPGRPVLGFMACGAIVRRDAFLAAGGFHPRLGVGGEEWLLAVDLRLRGWGLAYVSEIVAHHHPPGGCDLAPRRIQQRRNELVCAWLRRRPARALHATALALASAGNREARAALMAAVADLPWVLRERRPVPRNLERELASLD